MSDASNLLKTEFPFGSTTVRIIQGNILAPDVDVDAVVSSDDNYLTMGGGVSRLLAEQAGPEYVRAAQVQCPVRAGAVVATKAYRLPKHGLNVKHVLHGAVIDYDTYDLPLEQVVYQVTANSLEKAEELGLSSILFPAFATGAGGLAMETCARQMCSAIKAYLAQERPLKMIYVILYLPQDTNGKTDLAKVSQRIGRNQRFFREANLVLGVPYNPALNIRQTRDFCGRADALQKLEEVITDKVDGKRHAVILGGPRIGKWVLLDQLFHQAQQPGSPLSQGRRVAQVTFGRVHQNTPAPFIYHKLLRSLGEGEEDAQVIEELGRAYADASMNCDHFLKFLEDHSDHYPQVVFLMDHLPQLLQMGAADFWRDLDRLGERVRLVFTATEDKQYQALQDQFSDGFKAGLEEIRLKCVEEQKRRTWINALYQRYLDRSPTDSEHDFFKEEAGRHPYLISLSCYALIEALKRDVLTNPMHPTEYNRNTLAPFFQTARSTMEGPRRAFFDLLMGPSLAARERSDLQNLAQAIAIEEERQSLLRDLDRDPPDPDAVTRWQELQKEGDPRQNLHDETLRQLEARGYLVDAASPATAQSMARSFAIYMAEFFGVGRRREEDDQPRDVVISLLSPEPQVISTLFRGRGARIVTAQKQLLPEIKAEFMDSFGRYISHRLHPDRYPASELFKDLEEVGNYVLTQFATGAIKRYLQNPPQGSTISLVVHDDLKDIPWELMLETAYAGEIPFRVGRSIVSPQQPTNINPPVRGDGRIKALLIGDPTDDLAEARNEVQNLADRLRRDDHSEDPDVLIGSEQCQRITLLNALASGKYALIHYSGHSRFDGYQSAWQLKDGKDITTDLLTSALQMTPPAFVFSSSCESAVGGEPQPIQYEDQTFDLPSAFLQAGVEAYIGTLWEVESLAARRFVEIFYGAFLSGEHNLGECLRRAKWACKQQGDRINWPAFILYGEPHTEPGDLFPALRKQKG
jgi:O-acetyl-ADP-ribose deacetylase (regulator of RNase III)